MSVLQSLVDALWEGEKSVGFFVHSGEYHWVVDDKHNFSLDAEKDYRGYLEKGHISEAQYLAAVATYRNGIKQLTEENFPRYLKSKGVLSVSESELFELATSGVESLGMLHERIENYYLSGMQLSSKDFRLAHSIVSTLPLFYINFDRKIYLHMDFGRSHHELAYSDWAAGSKDFCHLIPDKARYWVSELIDLWKYRYL